MGVRLPPEYQEVEYLESDKNQRIVLNIKPSITDVITIKYKLTNIEYNTGIYGCASEPVYFGIGTNANFANYYAQIGGGAYRQSSVPKDTNIHTHVLDMPRLIYSVDGIETSLAGLTPNPNTNTGYGLWFHHGASSSYLRYTAGRIYFFDIKDRITLVPCYRKSDDKPGMYDLVSGTFFTNVGTGEFIVGSDVIDSISPWLVARRRALMKLPKAGGTSDYFVENIVAQRSAITGLGFYPLAEDVAFTLLVDFQIVSPTTPNITGIDIVSCGFTTGSFPNAIRICYYGRYFMCRLSSGSDFYTTDQDVINGRKRCVLRYDPSLTNTVYARWKGRNASQAKITMTVSQQEAKTGGSNGRAESNDNYANINGVYFYKRALTIPQMESFLNKGLIP